jgi:dTDP-4-dehydrorhamnose 3,5-epimerase
MRRFSVSDLPLVGLKRIERQPIADSRGFLARMFCNEQLACAGWVKPVAQINHTGTVKKGTVRGLHFQRNPFAEMKLVSCLQGEVWDVAVDLRVGSPTFLRWHAERLSAENGCALLIPEGFAHGFQTLTEDVQLLYCHSAIYAAEAEGGLNPTDPCLEIAWPLGISELSVRDAAHPLIRSDFEGVHA